MIFVIVLLIEKKSITRIYNYVDLFSFLCYYHVSSIILSIYAVLILFLEC
jgi:hypothetical protein